MPVLYFTQMQIKPLLLCSAQKHVRLAFVTSALYNAIQGNQTSGTRCFISSMYFIFPFWKTGWDLKVWVIPLPSLLGICCWCLGELPPAPGYPHQVIVVEGFPHCFPRLHWTSALRFILLKSNRVKKTRLLLGSELRHSCWSLKTAECFATDVLGGKNPVSLTEVTDRGPFAPQGLSQPCTQTLWLQGLRAALPGCCEDILEQIGGCPLGLEKTAVLFPSSGSACRVRSCSHHGLICSGGKRFPNSYH